LERLRGAVTTADARNLGILLVAVLLLWIPRFEGAIDLRWDAGVYYILGTSLAEGRGYRLLNEPGEIEAVQYPPLLPVVVAAVQKAVGSTDSARAGHALRLLFFTLSLAYVAVSYVLARQFLPPLTATLVGALSSLHQGTVFLTDVCFTEVPYGLVTMLFLLALRLRAGSAAAVLGALAFLLRSSGIALLGAWVAEAALKRRAGQTLLRIAFAAFVVLSWQRYVAGVTRTPEYQHPFYGYQRAAYQYHNVPYVENLKLVDPFRPERGRLSRGDLARRLIVNAARMPVSLGGALSVPLANTDDPAKPGDASPRDRAIAAAARFLHRLLMGVAVLAGLAGLARQGEWTIPLYVVASLVLISITPWPTQFGRYLTPLTPLLALALGVGFAGLSGKRSEAASALKSALAGLVIVSIVTQGRALVVLYTRNFGVAEEIDRSGTRTVGRLFYYDEAERSYDESLTWLAEHAGPTAVVATSAPHKAFLRTGRKAVLPPMEVDPVESQRLLDSVPVSYLIVDELGFLDLSRRYGEATIRAHPMLWELVYDRGTRIYERRPTAP
jgi:hypothetical protein